LAFGHSVFVGRVHFQVGRRGAGVTQARYFVQNLVSRRHLYTAAAITAYFYDRASGRDLEPRPGTAFVVWAHQPGRFFVTNRHIVDAGPTAALDRVELSGHVQPDNENEDTIAWTYTHRTPNVTFHSDPDTDLAVISVPLPSDKPGDGKFEQPARWSANGNWNPTYFDTQWLASDTELSMLLPGDQVFIAGYPGVSMTEGGGRSAEKDDRPIIVGGIIASDPRHPAMFGDAVLRNAVLCHSFSWGGMSGAPVFAFSQHIGVTKLIGINAGHIRGQGPAGGVISHFVRSSALIDLLVELGETRPQPLTKIALQEQQRARAGRPGWTAVPPHQ
jgi:hypothetical protein